MPAVRISTFSDSLDNLELGQMLNAKLPLSPAGETAKRYSWPTAEGLRSTLSLGNDDFPPPEQPSIEREGARAEADDCGGDDGDQSRRRPGVEEGDVGSRQPGTHGADTGPHRDNGG